MYNTFEEAFMAMLAAGSEACDHLQADAEASDKEFNVDVDAAVGAMIYILSDAHFNLAKVWVAVSSEDNERKKALVAKVTALALRRNESPN